LSIRDDEVQRLNLRVKQLQSDIKDVQSQFEISEDKVELSRRQDHVQHLNYYSLSPLQFLT